MATINFNIPTDLNIGGNLYIQGVLVTPGGGGGGGASSGIPTLNGLSGALTLAGRGTVSVSTLGTNQILISGDPSISGYVNSVSGGLQAQIAGGGTQVKISGSSTLSTADFTGLGGTLVFWSGGKVFISGAGAGGGGVAGASSGIPTLNGLSGALNVVGTGYITVTTGLQKIIISGDYFKVSGPASSTDNGIALWDGTSGTLLKSSSTVAAAISGVSSSAGPADSGKVPLLNASGKFDPSFITGVSAGGGGSGNVSGPASSTDSRVALWDGTSGRLLKDSTAFAISGVTSTSGPANSGMIPLLNASGKLDPSFITGVVIGGSSGIRTLNGLSGDINIVGTGGLTVFTVGQNILISGGQTISGFVVAVSGALQTLINAGGGGGGASSGIPTLNGLSGALTLVGTGGLSVSTFGTNKILISGDQSISGYVGVVSGVITNTVVPIAKGGTSQTTAVAARAALNVGDTALTCLATVATDASLGNVFKLSITGNCTLGAPTNLQAGATYIWRIQQDISGKRTLGYNGVFKFSSGLAPTLTTGVSGIDIISSVSDGTNVFSSFMPDFR